MYPTSAQADVFDPTMKKIALIGCTGSIGRQVCEVVRSHKTEFCFSALVAGSDRAGLDALKEEFRPKAAYLAAEIPSHSALFADCDVAFIASGGFAGLKYTLAAIENGKTVALANKESLVCGGELVMRAAKESGADIVPVDSEHSALFQCLGMRRDAPYKKLILTASGGPFLHLGDGELKRVTAADALRHPTWKMGAKITIDSATLLNKGYEVIEAKWLYGADFSQIQAVVHPESIVHSIVLFEDGAMLAQLGYPDMKLPIQLALTYPARLPCCHEVDLAEIGTLHFERLPEERFPCFGLAVAAGKEGGTAPTVLNGAAETAVHAFLQGRISFLKIAETIEEVLSRIPAERADGYGTLSRADARAREEARRLIDE